jgi:uncharacterized protein
MLRVVFDTVVFVRSLINPHSRWGRLVFTHYPGYRLFLSQPVILEVLDVLRRPELIRKFRSLQGMDVGRIIEILGQAEIVEVSATPAVSRDVEDDKFLATAQAAGAEYLVTEDEDLLVIGEYEGIRIIDAATFLGILEERD